MEQEEFKKQLHQKAKLLRQQEVAALDETARKLAFRRRRFLSSISTREDEAYPEPSVFVSFASQSGQAQMLKAKKAFEDTGFTVRTGFDQEIQRQDDKISAIKKHIRACSAFLGILTPEYELRPAAEGSSRMWCPGVWVLEEKGIAEAYEIPIRLMIDQRIHDHFYTKIKGDKLQNVFNEGNFESTLKQAVDALVQRYHERFLMDYVN